jgi:hypothetical protein
MADRATLHLQIVAGIPLALETYVHDSFGCSRSSAAVGGTKERQAARANSVRPLMDEERKSARGPPLPS